MIPIVAPALCERLEVVMGGRQIETESIGNRPSVLEPVTDPKPSRWSTAFPRF